MPLEAGFKLALYAIVEPIGKGGRVLYISEGALWAIAFDADAGSLQGTALRVVDDVVRYRVGDDGTLAYVQGTALERNRLVWVSRSGVETSALTDAQAFRRPRLSPDGRYVAVEIRYVTMQGDLWIYDLETGTRTRLTFGDYNTDPVWNPNGIHVTYATGEANSSGIGQRAIDGSGETEALVDGLVAFPHSWSPDGQVLAFYAHEDGGAGPRSIWTLSLDDGAEPRPFLRTAFQERSPSFSPSGRFIAYASNESGEDQIYIQAFPGPGAKIAVSRVGGHEPVWSPDGTELFFRRGGEVWAARVRHGSRLEVSEPSLLFEGPYVSGASGSSGSQTYDVAPDGRFLMVKRDESPTSRFVVVRNWMEERKRLGGLRIVLRQH